MEPYNMHRVPVSAFKLQPAAGTSVELTNEAGAGWTMFNMVSVFPHKEEADTGGQLSDRGL